MSVVHISIVTYHTPRQMLEKVLQSIESSLLVHCIDIVDNSADDKIREYLPAGGKINYIYTGKNGGYGFGHNISIRRSLDKNATYHLVLNPDMYFDPAIFDTIVKYMDQHRDTGNLMPRILYPDLSVQYLCKLLPTPYDWIGRRFNPFRKMVEKRNEIFELKFTGYNRIMEVPYLSGCFMFLNLAAIRKTGFFDEGIFMYGEETDLCRRLIQAGYKTIFFPEAEAIHEFQKGSHKSYRLTWIGIKSAIYYFNKWGWFFDKRRRAINAETISKLNGPR